MLKIKEGWKDYVDYCKACSDLRKKHKKAIVFANVVVFVFYTICMLGIIITSKLEEIRYEKKLEELEK